MDVYLGWIDSLKDITSRARIQVREARPKKRTTTKATKAKTVPYDVAAQLRTPKEMAAYLDAWLSEAPEDVTGIARALGDIARAKGMSEVARETGLSRESLYKALSASGKSQSRHGSQGCEGARATIARGGRVGLPRAWGLGTGTAVSGYSTGPSSGGGRRWCVAAS